MAFRVRFHFAVSQISLVRSRKNTGGFGIKCLHNVLLIVKTECHGGTADAERRWEEQKKAAWASFLDVCLEDADPSSPTTDSEDSLLQAFPEPSIIYHHVPKDSFRRHLREFETAKAESRRNMDVSVLFVLAQTLPWHLAPGSS